MYVNHNSVIFLQLTLINFFHRLVIVGQTASSWETTCWLTISFMQTDRPPLSYNPLSESWWARRGVDNSFCPDWHRKIARLKCAVRPSSVPTVASADKASVPLQKLTSNQWYWGQISVISDNIWRRWQSSCTILTTVSLWVSLCVRRFLCFSYM